MVYLLIFFLVVVADQLSKFLADAYLPTEGITFIDKIFSLKLSYNRGAAFSFLSGKDWAQTFFLVVTILAVVLSLTYLIFSSRNSKWLNTTVTLIIAGAVGNLIDRVALSEVRDFLDIEFFANCNVADVAITVGAIMLFVYFLFVSEDAMFKGKKKNAKT